MVLRFKKFFWLMTIFLFLMLIQTVHPALLLAAEKIFQNSKGMRFALIPAGTFIMGSPSAEPGRGINETQHEVVLSRPFYMQDTELTVRQWRALMGKKWFGSSDKGENMPMVKVSWFDAIHFIEKLNELQEGTYRLPTEAEWEYAARAGSAAAFSWGKEAGCSKAMFSNNTLKSKDCVETYASRGFPTDGPAPVKSFQPNAWGLFDMHGNVWEWCQDWYGPYGSGRATDPKGPDTGLKKVRRGGSWFATGDLCRAANRNTGHPGSKHRTLGFRVVREVP
jgi:formylglycine-generating enzyme required for sulfatase activity